MNWNVRDLLKDCLNSVIKELNLNKDQYELIVVDNASEDDSVTMVRADFADVKLIESSVNLGFAAGCNLGYAGSRGDFVLLLNPDTLVIEHAIDEMLDELKCYPGAGILGTRLINTDKSFQRASGGAFATIRTVAWNYLFLNQLLPSRWGPLPLFFQDDPQGTLEVDWVSGAAMLLRREALDAQIFDELFFMFGEDMDLCDRMKKKGWQVLYSSRQSIVHYHGGSFNKQSSAEILAMAHKGPRRFFEKRHNRIMLVIYDLILLIGFLVRWPLFRGLSLLMPGRGYAELAKLSRQYVVSVLRLRGMA